MGLLDFFRKPEWRVDSALPRHAAQIAALHAQSFARGWSTAEIEGLMADRRVVTDVLRSKPGTTAIDGFALSRIAADEAELLTIAVSSRCRGKGASGPLLARHMARLRMAGARRVVLEVDEGNAPALNLYRRYGFEEVATRPSYYTRADGSRGSAKVLARALG